MTNKIKPIKPTIRPIITSALLQPAPPFPALLNPYTIPPNPNVDKAIETKSILGFVRSITFFNTIEEYTNANKAIGRTVKNNILQDKYSTIRPDIVGPIAGANRITTPKTPITDPLFLGSITERITALINGRMTPVPIA